LPANAVFFYFFANTPDEQVKERKMEGGKEEDGDEYHIF